MSAIRIQDRFTEDAGETLLAWRMLFETVTEYEKAKTYSIEANEQNFDRLEQLIKMRAVLTS